MCPQGASFFSGGQAVKDACRRAGQQALRGAVGNRLAHALVAESVGQYRHSGTAIRRFFRLEAPFYADLRVTPDHARAVAAGGTDGGIKPMAVVRGDDQPRVPQAESFGERVDDLCRSDEHRGLFLQIPFAARKFPGSPRG